MKIKLTIGTDGDCEMLVAGMVQPEMITVLITREDFVYEIKRFLSIVSFEPLYGKDGIPYLMREYVTKAIKELEAHDPNKHLPFSNPVDISIGGNQYISIKELVEPEYDFVIGG